MDSMLSSIWLNFKRVPVFLVFLCSIPVLISSEVTRIAHPSYWKACPQYSNTLTAGRNRLRDCLCDKNYYPNVSSHCIPCAFGYRKQSIGNFDCSCYVFDSCDPPVCNGDGSSCRPILVISESKQKGFALQNVLPNVFGNVDNFDSVDTVNVQAEVAKEGFEFSGDGSTLISVTSVSQSRVVNGTKQLVVTNVITKQNIYENTEEIQVVPIVNEVIKSSSVSPVNDNVFVLAGEKNIYLYDESEEQVTSIAHVKNDTMQCIDVACSSTQGSRTAIAFSADYVDLDVNMSSFSRRRLLQQSTSDVCGTVQYLTANLKSSTKAKSYVVCNPFSVSIYTSSDTQKDYILVGTPCRIVRIDIDNEDNIKTFAGPGSPDQLCQVGDYGTTDKPIRFQDARRILVDKTGSEVYVFDKNRIRKLIVDSDEVSGITTIETFSDDDAFAISNFVLSADGGSILFSKNQKIDITVNASTWLQQPSLENNIQRMDLIKPKESRNGLYCLSNENKKDVEVTCDPNKNTLSQGLLCKNGIPCVCLHGFYLKNNKCEKCKTEYASIT